MTEKLWAAFFWASCGLVLGLDLGEYWRVPAVIGVVPLAASLAVNWRIRCRKQPDTAAIGAGE